jgi:hypothetical protein
VKRKSRHAIWILAAFLCISIFIVQYVQRDKDIEIFNVDWNCNDVNCNISFEVESRRMYPVFKDLRIRAISDGYSKYGSKSRPVGEKVISIELSSNELIRIEEKVNVSSDVNRVIVSPWDK